MYVEPFDYSVYRQIVPVCVDAVGYQYEDKSFTSFLKLPSLDGYDIKGGKIRRDDLREQINRLGLPVKTPCPNLRHHHPWRRRSVLGFSSARPRLGARAVLGYTTGGFTRVSIPDGSFLAYLSRHANALGLTDTQRAYLHISWLERRTAFNLLALHLLDTFTDAQMLHLTRQINALTKRVVAGTGGAGAFYWTEGSFQSVSFVVATPAVDVINALQHELFFTSFVVETYDALFLDTRDGTYYNTGYCRDNEHPAVYGGNFSERSKDQIRAGFGAVYRNRKLHLLANL